MGFIAPAPPPVNIEEWQRLSHLQRIKPLAQDWALNGLGTPDFVYLLYIVKLAVYAGGGLLLISASTKGLGGLGDLGKWWTQPIVFQKAVVWTMLWEVLGLGAGSMPLTLRFSPMIGGVLYWLRPGTTRPPPWPGRVPLTRGTTRTLPDVALYAACSPRRCTCCSPIPARPPAPRPAASTQPRWGCCWRLGSCSACATRSRSSRRARRSTGT